MNNDETSDKPVVELCAKCPYQGDLKDQRRRLAKILLRAAEGLEDRLNNNAGGLKPSVGDYLKLLEYAKEIEKEDEEPKEVKFTWVDPVSKRK